MRRRRRKKRPGLALACGLLGLEAAAVIGLRGMRLARGGPAAQSEVRRMATEKLEAALALQALALTGGLGTTAAVAASRTLQHYRRKVRANRRRLGKP